MQFSIRNKTRSIVGYKIIYDAIISLALIIYFINPLPCFGNDSTLKLSPEELSWINQKHTVRVRIGSAPPFMLTDGKVRGIAIDYLITIFNRHGIEFVYVQESDVTWPQALKYIEQHDVVDMVPTAKITDERKKHMLFTNEYLVAPWVIFTRSDADFVSSIDDLKGKTVSVEEGFVIHDLLKRNYPEINLKIVPAKLDNNFAEIPIKDLSTGLADAYIGNLLMTTYLIQSKGYANVKVAAPTPFENHNQAMAIRDDWPELVSIINKTIAAMTPEEHAAIRNRWLGVRYEYGINKTDVIKWVLSVAGVLSFFVGFVLIWNRRLKAEVIFRKKIERDLLKSENKYRIIAENMADIITTMDMNLRFTYVSPSIIRLRGFTVEEALEQTIDQIMTPDSFKLLAKAYEEELGLEATGTVDPDRTRTLELEEYKKDGSTIWVENTSSFIRDKDQKPIGILVVSRDISGRRRAEAELRKLSSHQEALLSAIPDIVMQVDHHKVYTWANQPGYNFFGDDVIGKEASHYFEDEQKIYQVVQSIFNGEEDVIYLENWQRRKDGEKRLLAWWCKVLKDENADIMGALSTARDITDQRKIQEQLRQAHKMESIGSLAGGIAHEFNNILSIIIGNNELVMEEIPEWSLARESTEEIRIASMRARDVVKQLLTFSRHDTAEKKIIDIKSVVNDSMKLIRSSTPVNIKIQQTLSDDVSPVFGNATQINQILINLCNNAIDAMPNIGGKLEVELLNETIEENQNKCHTNLKSGPYVKLTVSDNGIGMDKEILDRVFDPYYTTKEIGKGTGIGLAVVHGIVEKHGGSIIVDSHPGQGTTFTIFLPGHEGQLEHEADKPVILPTGNENILYVDDEPFLAKLGKRHLESLGYTVESKTDPLEALETVKTEPHKFDLVISDMAMPNMTGDQLIVEILKLRPDMPTIICTGYSAKVSEKEAARIGVSSFAMKPLNRADLAKTVRKVLDEANRS